jgi:arylsulfatase A-like enzyme
MMRRIRTPSSRRLRSCARPKDAPNVLIVLLDDAGFGSSSAFGGPCNTPTAESLAAGGPKYNRFHTTALCSPTRQALLTGRNHHTVGMGGITEIASGSPGYNSNALLDEGYDEGEGDTHRDCPKSGPRAANRRNPFVPTPPAGDRG